MRRVVALCLLASVIVAAFAGMASGSVNRRTPPRISVIHKGEVIQAARPYTYCWSYGTRDGGGVGMCADGWPTYPDPAPVSSGAKVTLRIGYPSKPVDWFIESHRVILDQNGHHEALGPAEEISFRLRPHRVDGVVRAWDLVFRPEEPLRHYYIDTGGQLRQGDAFYALHLQT